MSTDLAVESSDGAESYIINKSNEEDWYYDEYQLNFDRFSENTQNKSYFSHGIYFRRGDFQKNQ